MKPLFDQNLSPELVRRLADVFPDSTHVFVLGLDLAEDIEICEFAAKNDFAIVTKDADYSELLGLKNYSPKIVWIRKGNCPTDAIEILLRKHSDQINALSVHEAVRLLMLF
ncbi:MAG: DUF5615 family PIN-like protein [Pyrinomonadaceae bacterium]